MGRDRKEKKVGRGQIKRERDKEKEERRSGRLTERGKKNIKRD